MAVSGLADLARKESSGRARFRIVQSPHGELVLRPPDDTPPSGYRPLPGIECMRLAALADDRPSLVVENAEGDYVVLVDAGPDRDRHMPLNLDDADVLAGTVPSIAQFGRRDDDILQLTPWEWDAPLTEFDPNDEPFIDVPLVALRGGELTVARGELSAHLGPAVRAHLERIGRDPDIRYGVFANPFGEFSCVAVGSPIEAHEDVRRQAVIRGEAMLDGAATLGEAARILRSLADQLEIAESRGWVLPHPITDDHGFPEHPTA